MLGSLVKSVRDCVYWGVELDAEAAACAQDHLDAVINADAESRSLELPDSYFDCIVFGDVLEHLVDPEAFLIKVRSSLKPGARLVANVPNIAHWSVICGLLQGNFEYASEGLLDRTHKTFFTIESFRTMLWRAGYVPLLFDPFLFPDDCCDVLASAAASLGTDPEIAKELLSVYQFTAIATVMDEQKINFVGPHVGELGKARVRGSAIIVTSNSEPTIRECIESLLNTTPVDVEIIVVDNASTDTTLELVDAYPHERIKQIRNPANIGYALAMNQGILASSGKIIISMNPDSQVFPDWFAHFEAALECKFVGAAGPLSDRVSGDQFVGRFLRAGHTPKISDLWSYMASTHSGETAETRLLVGFCIGYRREFLDETGLLDEELVLGCDDLEMSWRIRNHKYKLLIMLDTFVRHHQGVSFKRSPVDYSHLTEQSNNALFAKLQACYGCLEHFRSRDLWSNNIFDPVLQANLQKK